MYIYAFVFEEFCYMICLVGVGAGGKTVQIDQIMDFIVTHKSAMNIDNIILFYNKKFKGETYAIRRFDEICARF